MTVLKIDFGLGGSDESIGFKSGEKGEK